MTMTPQERKLIFRRRRGLIRRVAERFDIDPSHVSRVARGERRSKLIEAALAKGAGYSRLAMFGPYPVAGYDEFERATA